MSLKSTTTPLTTTAVAVFTPTQVTPEARIKADVAVLVGGADAQLWTLAANTEMILREVPGGDAIYVKAATGTGNALVLATGQ